MVEHGGFDTIVAIDKSAHNAAILARYQPTVQVEVADLTKDGWQHLLEGADALVIGQAQIGGTDESEFIHNNIDATTKQIEAAIACNVSYIVGISSSVVNSMAVDYYTETKKAQEKLFDALTIDHIVLRPTLMFGWFDRKHMGWLARFMQKMPVFPIPGNGRYMRQPLYVGDFCDVIIASILNRKTGSYNISGQEKIDYVDLMKVLKTSANAGALIFHIPTWAFRLLLQIFALGTKNPPFTEKQLEALMTPDEFEVIDWPTQFGVRSTPLEEALLVTFRHPVYSKVTLQF